MVETFPSDGSYEAALVPLRPEGKAFAVPCDIDALQESFIRAHELERRMPGAGRWPFAGDGPWNLIQGEAGDYGGDGQDGASSSRAPRPPLDAGEVAEYRQALAWLEMVEDAGDRRLVWLATGRLAAGEGRVPWTAIGRKMRSTRSPDALVRRYRKALATVVCRLNGWPVRRARAMAA